MLIKIKFIKTIIKNMRICILNFKYIYNSIKKFKNSVDRIIFYLYHRYSDSENYKIMEVSYEWLFKK